MKILYEDSDIVAVNKPSGVEITDAGAWFKARYPEIELERSYAHRLDRDTSGALLFAKNAKAYDFYRQAFTDRLVGKTYLAFVYGVLKEKRGTIDFSIGRSRRDFRLRSAQPKAKGRLREALTRFEVLGEADGCSLLLVRPETGRTHQIRVHLKAIHHPIVGDRLYGPTLPPKADPPLAGGLTRLGLHAYALDLPMLNGERMRITAPIPPDLLPALKQFPGAATKFAEV